jgi:ssDNA-binding Zn-finger/Zn-ribbon topoisomerase 1
MSLQPNRNKNDLLSSLERILDKGVVINADILVSVAGVELLGIRLRAALASFETAARYGLEFPSGTNISTETWKKVIEAVEACPQCEKKIEKEELLEVGCPWCGWISAKALRKKKKLGEIYVSP